MMSFSRGSGSRIDKRDYKSRPFTYVHKGKTLTDEIPAFGLLLQSSDAATWKECIIDYLKRHGAMGILDTYSVDANQLNQEFRKKLETESTPRKAKSADASEENKPVAGPVNPAQLHRFSATDLKLIASKNVFNSRFGY